MEKTLLWEAFSTLSTQELVEFERWLQSPFFNTRKNILALFSYLEGCLKKKQSPMVDPALKVIRPFSKLDGKTSPEQTLRIANSLLLAQLEQFWLYKEKNIEPSLNAVQRAGIYRKRNLSKHFQIAVREAQQSLDAEPWRNAAHFHHQNLLEWEQYQQFALEKRTEALNLQENSDLMDLVFISRKLYLACLVRSHEAVYKTAYDVGFLEQVLATAENKQLLSNPAVGLYYYCYRFLQEPDVQHANAYFASFNQLLQEHHAAIPREELRTLYLLAINFGIKKSNESAEGWLEATLNLYKNALNNDLLVENGSLSRFAFNNIMGIALRVGEIDWAENFVLQYKPLLERQWRDTTASLCLARIAYTRSEYKTALLHLQRSDYKDLIHNLTAKTLQLKIFYETKEWSLLESHLKSMKTYLKRHTSFGYHHKNFGKIIYYTQQLILKAKDNKTITSALMEEIKAETTLTEKEWLVKMAEKAGIDPY